MKKFSKMAMLGICCIVSLLSLLACKVTPKYALSSTNETYFYGDILGMELDLPTVVAENNREIGLDNLEWSTQIGSSAELSNNGKFILNNESGITVFRVNIKDGKERASLTYTVNVEGGYSNALNWSLSGVDYSLSPGIAKRRVFGNKNIQNGVVVPAREQITLIPGFEGITEKDYTVTISNDDVLDYEFVGDNKIELAFTGIGKSTLRIELDRIDEQGDIPLVVYNFEVTDGINVSTVEELKQVQQLTTYLLDTNQYSYGGKYQNYIGTDGKNFENIVLRKSIYNIDDISLFYGNVYGNGYTLDATPYAQGFYETQDAANGIVQTPIPVKHPTGDKGNDNASFYLMSDNTILDNINLVGFGGNIDNLNQLNDKKVVLTIYGVQDTQKTLNVSQDDLTIRQPKNIKITNSIIESGYRAINISGGATDKDNPIVIESSVLRRSSEFGIWIITNWQRMDGGLYNDGTAKEYKNFITFKNNIISDVKMAPIGIQNGLVDSAGLPTSPGYGTHLTILGEKNYFYNWIKYSEMDFGTVYNAIDIAQVVQTEFDKPENEDLREQILYSYIDENSTDKDPYSKNNVWYNVGIWGNFIMKSRTGDYVTSHANTVDFQNSNLLSIWQPEFNIEIGLYLLSASTPLAFVETSLYFASPNIEADAPRPETQKTDVVDKISNIPVASNE